MTGIDWVITVDEWQTCSSESHSCLHVVSWHGLTSLSPSKHFESKQGTSAGKAIFPLGPHLSFPIYTAMCTHLNDKLVCTQIHYEHLGTKQEERMTVTDCKISQQELWSSEVGLFRVFLHYYSHTVEASVYGTVDWTVCQNWTIDQNIRIPKWPSAIPIFSFVIVKVICNCINTIIHAELWRYSVAPAYKSYSRHILQT